MSVKKKNRNRKRRDDRGVSLLEVIMAAMIFSILALILLKGFVAASQTNQKAGRQQKITNIAQNIMEELKAKELEELALEFNQPVNAFDKTVRPDIKNISKEEILDGTVTFREVDASGAPVKNSSIRLSEDKKSYTFVGQEKGRYYFEILNISEGKESYDALITLDGVNNRIYKDDYKDKINNYEAPNIGNLNVYEHAFLVVGTPELQGTLEYQAYDSIISKQQTAANEALSMAGLVEEAKFLKASELSDQCKRTLTVKVEETAGSTKVTAVYQLQIPGLQDGTIHQEELGENFPCPGNASTRQHDGRGGCFCTDIIDDQVFYDNSETGSKLQGIYLFYVPNYRSRAANAPLDQIIFENPGNIQVPLYITKQLKEGRSYADIRSEEQSYKMSLTVRENPIPTWNTLASQFRGATSLRTNLDTNIGYENMNDRNTSAAPRQMTLTYKDQSDRYRTGDVAKAITQMNGLEDAQEKYRIFSAKVSLYPAGTLTGVKQEQWKEHQLVELKGSAED